MEMFYLLVVSLILPFQAVVANYKPDTSSLSEQFLQMRLDLVSSGRIGAG